MFESQPWSSHITLCNVWVTAVVHSPHTVCWSLSHGPVTSHCIMCESQPWSSHLMLYNVGVSAMVQLHHTVQCVGHSHCPITSHCVMCGSQPWSSYITRCNVWVTAMVWSHHAVCAVTGSSPSTYGVCSGDVSLISGCTPVVDPVPTDLTKFQFALHECATPSITALSSSNGTTMDTLTMDGSGFGTTGCQNEVSVTSPQPPQILVGSIWNKSSCHLKWTSKRNW